MKLVIDNFDSAGPRDYTRYIEGPNGIAVHRYLNRSTDMQVKLVGDISDLVVPTSGASVQLLKNDGTKIFTGRLSDPPEYEYLGWTMKGPAYRYKLSAKSDEWLLDRKSVPVRAPMVGRTAGTALKLLTEAVLPGAFDSSQVDDVAAIASFEVKPEKTWSEHAFQLAMSARAVYRVHDSAMLFKSIPPAVHPVDESAPGFAAAQLRLQHSRRLVNDFTVIGELEPQAYVKDYFCGDGLSLRFDLSQIPFTRPNRTLLDEEFKGTSLAPVRWIVEGTPNSVSVAGGRLQIQSSGADGSTVVQFAENIEIGGALILQHGQINISAASNGVLGGLYSGPVFISNCLTGFRVTPSGGQSAIQALVRGAGVGPVTITTTGHQYRMTTRLYASEIYRANEVFHSSVHPDGTGRGGGLIGADVRIVMEVQDIDPANPASVAAPAMVLYDGLVYSAPQWCCYALINGGALHCDVTFTRVIRPVDAEVRSAAPSENYRTRLAGALSEGAECSISQSPALQFFSAHVPESNESIVVSYRGQGRAAAHINDPSSISAEKDATDNGIFGAVCAVRTPSPRTSVDCQNAALALLDDGVRDGWAGECNLWSNSLLAGQDIYPGDAVDVSAASRGAQFRAIVRDVQIKVQQLDSEELEYTIRFADDKAEPLAIALSTATPTVVPSTIATGIPDLRPGLAALTSAELTDVTSTYVSIDAGLAPPTGGGIEVRRSDAGWSLENDRNLIGRFGGRVITLPRLSRVQDYYLRQYDASTPANYSSYSAAIHVDYPL